jgi:hypothetical protein
VKTIIVDFDKRTKNDSIYLTKEQSVDLKSKEKVRLTDNDIAVKGTVVRSGGSVYVKIDWHTTEYDLPSPRRMS